MGLILGVFLACIAGYSTHFGVSNFLEASAFIADANAFAAPGVGDTIQEAAIGLGVAVGSATLAIVLVIGNMRDSLRRREEERIQRSERPTLAA
jgi:hypothetical protein